MALEATALLGGAALPARRMRRQCILMTWPSSIGLKRHGMAWHFPFGSPPGRFVQFVQLAHGVTKELNTVVSRLTFCQLRKRKRKHLSSCAHEGQVLSKSALALSNGSPHDFFHWLLFRSHARLETRSSGTVERSHVGTLQLRTTNTLFEAASGSQVGLCPSLARHQAVSRL